MNAIVVSVRAGRIATLDRPAWDRHESRTWTSAYRKDEVSGRVRVERDGIVGDQQADRRFHGAEHQALLAYAAAHYPRWREELGLPGFGPGAFAENLAIDGLDETTVCIGDTWAVGDALVTQVTTPRGPCNNISMFWDRPDLLRRTQESHRPGWYLRVLAPGTVGVGDAVVLRERPHPAFTVRRLLELRAAPESDPAAVRALAACEPLGPDWRDLFVRLAAKSG